MTAFVMAVGAGVLLGIGSGDLLLAWAHGRRPRVGRLAGSSPPEGAGLLAPMLRWGRLIGRGVGRRLPALSDPAGRLDAAGWSPEITVEDLVAARGAAVIIGLAVALGSLSAFGGPAIMLVPIVPIALVLLPELLIGRRIRRRAIGMLDGLPDAVDLLRIGLRSGRSVADVLARVGAHCPGEIGTELRRTAAEVRIGVATVPALARLRRRCPADGAPELVALLMRAHQYGGGDIEGLRALADDLRSRRSRSAIDRAARAAPKIQLVVALLLVPAAMLLIAAVLIQLRSAG